MEQQLSSLSSLIQTALLPDKSSLLALKSEAQRQEMMDLRRQIMELREFPTTATNSVMESSTSTMLSNQSSSLASCTEHQKQTLNMVRNQLCAIRKDIEMLRKQAQVCFHS